MAEQEQVETPELESLDDVLSGEDVTVTETDESQSVSETQETETESTGEKEDSTPESGSTETSDGQNVPLAALLDERDKRQKLKAELEERDARLAELTKEPDKPRPDVFEDQDGAFEHVLTSFEQQRLHDRFELSRDFMGMIKDDYPEKEKVFLNLAKDSPELRDQLAKSPNPARFAYDTAVKHVQLQEMENIDDFREKIRAEERQKVLEELKAEQSGKAESDAAKRDAITPSLAKKRSTSGLDSVEDDELEDVLKNMG